MDCKKCVTSYWEDIKVEIGPICKQVAKELHMRYFYSRVGGGGGSTMGGGGGHWRSCDRSFLNANYF